jgi:hypothetical protein
MTFESHECWKVVDSRNKTWILQFRDPKEGLRALAVIGLCWAVVDTAQPSIWDVPTQNCKGKAVGADDTIKLSYHGFQIESFPLVDRYVLNQTSFNTRIDAKRSPPRFSDLATGMQCGGRRVIYMPSYPGLGSPVVFVVDLLRAKYASDPSAGPPEDEDEPPAPIIEPVEVPEVEAPRKPEIVSRMMKIGAQPVTVADSDRRVDERLEIFEREFDDRLKMLTEPLPVDQDAVITDITGLSVQLRTRQSQIEQLQRQLAEVKAATANSPAAREYDTMKREIDDGKRRGAQLDKRVRENGRKIEELEATFAELEGKAKVNGTGLIRRLMGSVFDEMVGAFEHDGRYTGQEIFGQLKTSLKRISLEILAELERNGIV